MKRNPLSIVALSVLAICLAARGTADDVTKADSQTLFNGTDLSGWDGDTKLWTVRDGVIHGETTPENKAAGNTFLIWTGGKLKNFDLTLSFRCSATNNSGIQYRSKHITGTGTPNSWVARGYQHEIRNENQLPDVSGFIYDEGGSRGRMCDAGEKAVWNVGGKEHIAEILDQAAFKKLMKIDGWNNVRIVADGANIKHYLNGTLILDFTDNEPDLKLSEGVLALQLHAGAPMFAEYKDIRLTTLP